MRQHEWQFRDSSDPRTEWAQCKVCGFKFEKAKNGELVVDYPYLGVTAGGSPQRMIEDCDMQLVIDTMHT